MAIRVQCPGCKKVFSAPDDYHNRKIKCSKCGTKFNAITIEELQQHREKRRRLAECKKELTEQRRQSNVANRGEIERAAIAPDIVDIVEEKHRCETCGAILAEFDLQNGSAVREGGKFYCLQHIPKLMKCRACGREISRNAIACPHCGEPNEEGEKARNEVRERFEEEEAFEESTIRSTARGLKKRKPKRRGEPRGRFSCPFCNQAVSPRASSCPHCGHPISKSRLVAGLLGVFIPLGIHRFYLGHIGFGLILLLMQVVGWIGWGIMLGLAELSYSELDSVPAALSFLALGLPLCAAISLIWSFVEGILILTRVINKDARGNYLH